VVRVVSVDIRGVPVVRRLWLPWTIPVVGRLWLPWTVPVVGVPVCFKSVGFLFACARDGWLRRVVQVDCCRMADRRMSAVTVPGGAVGSGAVGNGGTVGGSAVESFIHGVVQDVGAVGIGQGVRTGWAGHGLVRTSGSRGVSRTGNRLSSVAGTGVESLHGRSGGSHHCIVCSCGGAVVCMIDRSPTSSVVHGLSVVHIGVG